MVGGDTGHDLGTSLMVSLNNEQSHPLPIYRGS
jgi:hypothetical protein